MIEKLSPKMRKLMLECRCSAMSGDIDAVLSRLDNAVDLLSDTAPALDRVALLMLKAELLYLDYQYSEAMEVFAEINTYLEQLTHEERVVIEDNRTCVMIQAMQQGAVSSFYRQYDERTLAGVGIWNERAIMLAHDAAAEGKHYEALPGYWRQLVHSYRAGYWRAFVWASKTMSAECLSLGWLDQAAHHAVVAEEKESLARVGEVLLLVRDQERIARTVRKLPANANLRRHATHACSLLATIGDAIPDDQILSVTEWLMRWARLNPGSQPEINLFSSSWDAIKSVASRLSSDQVSNVLAVATSHEMWNAAHPCREHMIDAILECMPALSDEDLPVVAEKTIPLATDTKYDLDYVKVINILCQIAGRADEQLKQTIADALYPPGTQVPNSILLQVAPLFGKQPRSAEEVASLAGEVAQRLRLQVQRLAPDQEHARVSGTMMETASTRDNVKVVVLMRDHTDLGALVKFRHLLDEGALENVIDAILTMATDEDNTPSDKALLIHMLGQFADRMSVGSAEKVLTALLPIADGEIAVSPWLQEQLDSNNPLNSFKFNCGDIDQVRGNALNTLATVENAKPGTYEERLDAVLEKALSDENELVRIWAFKSACMLPKLSQGALTAVLIGTRDPNPVAAGWALGAVVSRPNLQLDEIRLHALMYSLAMAAQSPSADLRRSAASTAARLQSVVMSEELTTKLAHTRDILANDILYSVRNRLDKISGDNEPQPQRRQAPE